MSLLWNIMFHLDLFLLWGLQKTPLFSKAVQPKFQIIEHFDIAKCNG